MYIPALLSLSLLLLLCAPPWSTEVSAQSGTGNPSVDLMDHYGNVGPYFILLFYRYFNSDPMFLQAYLQQLKDAKWLRDYCKYLQVPDRTCVVTRPGTTPHATYIISYLNTECCGVEYVTIPPPPTTTTIPTSPTTPPTITTTPVPTTTTPKTTTTIPITTTTRTTTTTPTTTTTTPTVTTTTRTTTTTPTTTTTTPTTTTTTPTTTTPTTTTTTTATTTPPRSCGPVKVAVTQRIFGGVNAAQGEFPWVAQLLFGGDAQCACVIIDEYNCITAGHCVNYNSLNSGSMMVAAGKWRRALYADNTEQLRTVVRAKRHELFEDRLLKNDIALMRVNAPFVFNEYVYPVCLPSAIDVLPAFCEVAGFGSLSYLTVQVPDYMQKVSMNAYTREQCLQTFQSTTSYDINTYLHAGVMCAANGLFGGKDACRGDSGSSLMCLNADSTKYTLFGIVSSGFGCGDAGQPGFYTHIPTYKTWIDNAIVELSTPAGK